MTILTEAEIRERFKLTGGFIEKHSRNMGNLSRNPRTFILSRVEAYIESLASKKAAKVSPELEKARQKREFNQLFEESRRAIEAKKLRRKVANA
jgi:hypothetical protein